MGQIHIQNIRKHLENEFLNDIDLSDLKPKRKDADNYYLTRSLAAYAIVHHSHASVSEAANAVVDGFDDNGLDAIHYDISSKTLFLVQSKWIHNGKGEPSNGEVKKFISGIKDLFNFSFDRFNSKVQKKSETIEGAVCDPKTKYQIILAFTGNSTLSEPSRRDFDDLLADLNDTSEIVFFSIFNQKRIFDSLLSAGDAAKPIDIEANIKCFGKIDDPLVGFYGQISGSEVYRWWDSHRDRLFHKNIRGVLGETQVNIEISETLRNNPEHFWFFNNGITIICDKIDKAMFGAGATELGQFTATNISIVNGAQTVSTIGKFGEADVSKLDHVYVPIRIISLEGAESNFGERITKANNTQNRIESRDFVTFDPEQTRIMEELSLEEIDYRFTRGEQLQTDRATINLVESTTALACVSKDIQIVVQLKREIGKLWENIDKAPYKKLFNSGVTGYFVYNCVKTQRLIDRVLEVKKSEIGQGRDQGILIHGNRVISLIIFEGLDTTKYLYKKLNFEHQGLEPKIQDKVEAVFIFMKKVLDEDYQNAIIPTFFKNGTKCADLFDKVKELLSN